MYEFEAETEFDISLADASSSFASVVSVAEEEVYSLLSQSAFVGFASVGAAVFLSIGISVILKVFREASKS